MKKILFVPIFFLMTQTASSSEIKASSVAKNIYFIKKARTSFIENLKKEYENFEQSCGQKLWLTMDWTSFEDFLQKDSGWSLNNCIKPIKVIADQCKSNKKQALIVLDKIDTYFCTYANSKSDSLDFEKKKLIFKSDPTNPDAEKWISSILFKENKSKKNQIPQFSSKNDIGKLNSTQVSMESESFENEVVQALSKIPAKNKTVQTIKELGIKLRSEINKIEDLNILFDEKSAQSRKLFEAYVKKVNLTIGSDE